MILFYQYMMLLLSILLTSGVSLMLYIPFLFRILPHGVANPKTPNQKINDQR